MPPAASPSKTICPSSLLIGQTAAVRVLLTTFRSSESDGLANTMKIQQPTNAKKTGPPKPGQPQKPAATPPPAPAKVPPLFRKIDWLVLIVCFAAVWTAYLLTLAPDLTLEDSGELCTASFYAGIPHPPGYPFWAIYSWLWTVIVPFGSVTWRVEVGESFAAAMACGLVGLMVSRGSSMLIEGIEELKNMERKWENAICIVTGIV